MDYSGMTPAEVDNILVKAIAEKADAEFTVEQRTRHEETFQERIEKYSNMPDSPAENAKFFAGQVEKARTNLSEVQEALSEARKTIERTSAVIADINAEYDRRGGWTRYWIVTNTGGHIHSTMRCPTCFPTTVFAWLPDQAGMTAEELVELAGESACTVCFPDAPVDILRRPSKLEAPERKAAREKRDAEKAERERIKTEKAITAPDGSVLKLSGKWGDKIRTVSEAERRLVANMSEKIAIDEGRYGTFNKEFQLEKEADNRILLAALAHKFGKTEDELKPTYDDRAKKKFKRDWR